MRIALSTGGGDAPGLNAVIRAAVLSASGRGWEVLGIKHGYAGLMGDDEILSLTPASVRGIAQVGGTILGAASRGNPFAYPRRRPDGGFDLIDRSEELIRRVRELAIDAVISIGGDGSLGLAQRLHQLGLRIVGVPKTIDNDVGATITFGFDTAVNTAIEAIDKLHTTAESHDRVIVMEVMGRQAGFIALYAGFGGTADVILIPEIPYNIEIVCAKIAERDRAGRHFSIVVAAEGAYPIGGVPSTIGAPVPGQPARLGGVADRLAQEIQSRTGKECRSLVLGHLQRGGMPTGFDRILASRFGGAAIRAVAEERWGEMVALQGQTISTIPIAEALRRPKRVELSDDIVATARETGISFGD